MAKQRLSARIDAENMYRKGESFHFTSRFIQRQGLQVLGPAWCTWATNMAFACEAYLKVLAQLERNEPPFETHNLRELFHDLLPATQRELRRQWLKRDGKMLKAKNLPPKMAVKLKQAKTFEEALDLSAKAFVDWRYNDTSPNHWQVGSLPEILREHLLKLQPDWKPPAGMTASVLNPHTDFVKPQSEVKSVFPAGFTPLKDKPPAFKIKIGRVTDPKKGGSG